MTDEDPIGVDREFARWLDEHWQPDLTLGEWWDRLGTAGWSTPTWPREWSGRGLRRAEAVQVVDELRRRGIPGGPTGVGVDMAGPTILAGGDDERGSVPRRHRVRSDRMVSALQRARRRLGPRVAPDLCRA